MRLEFGDRIQAKRKIERGAQLSNGSKFMNQISIDSSKMETTLIEIGLERQLRSVGNLTISDI